MTEERKERQEARKWKEKGSIIYFFSAFSFLSLLHVTPVMFRTLDQTRRKKRSFLYGEKQTSSLTRPLTGKRLRPGNIILVPAILYAGSLLFKTGSLLPGAAGCHIIIRTDIGITTHTILTIPTIMAPKESHKWFKTRISPALMFASGPSHLEL